MADGPNVEALELEKERLRNALQQEQDKLRALQDIGAALGSTLDLDELLTMVLDRISQVMNADRSTLYLLDEDAGELWSKIAQGSHFHEIRLSVGEGLAGWVAETGQVLNIKDAYSDVRFDGEWDRRTGYRTRSTLCVPMKNQHGRTIGVVQVLNKHEGHFTREDESLLTSLAVQAAVCIENSKLFLSVVGKNIELLETKEQLEQKVRELDVLFEIAQVSASTDRLESLLEGVLARAMRAINAEAAGILLCDQDGVGEVRFRTAVGNNHGMKRFRLPRDEGISGWVAQHGRAQVVNRVEGDPRHSEAVARHIGHHAKSILCVPLRWDGGVGALELWNKGQGRLEFHPADLKLATVIAGHVSTAISLARAREIRAHEERLSTLGQFLSGVLHDLKTPMTVISGYVQLLADEGDGDKRNAFARTILKQVNLINAMTQETLAFARGDRKLWVRKVYLQKFFEDLVDQLRRDLEERNVTVELQLDDRGTGQFDEPKIQRAVHNLARNAAEAIGNRHGVFRITVDRRSDDGALVFRFSDDGPGVPEEIRERLFESFTTHGKEGGTGLGLAIVQKVVDDHGGLIDLQSSPGNTVFTITIPQPPGEPIERLKRSPPSYPPEESAPVRS